MSDNAQKTPLAQYLNQFAQKVVNNFVQQLGRSLPCSVVSVSGSVVTVSFQVVSQYTLPNVTIPVAGPEYIRYPTQVGDLGVVFPVQAAIGGVTGLGAGVANLDQQQGNLSNLVFFPVGSKNWSAADSARAVVIYGPDGAVLRTVARDSVLTVATGKITIKAAVIELDGAITVNGQVTGIAGTIDLGSSNLTTTGEIDGGVVKGAGTSLHTHVHSGVTSGGADTGPPA